MLSAARAARPRLCAAPRLPRPPRGRGLASSSGYAVGGEAQIGNPTGYPAGGAPAVLRERYGLWIGGEEVPSESGEEIEVENPLDRSVLTRVAGASAADVERAVAVASEAFADGRWSGMQPSARARVLNRTAELLRERIPEMARVESLTTGRPLREYLAQLGRVPEWFEYHGALAQTAEGSLPPFGDPEHLCYVRRVPLGVCALVTPWNHPLLIAAKKISACLAAGNTCVVKPPELAPVAVLELARILEQAGVPSGVVNVVPGFGGTAGAALCAHPAVAKVDFTGGTETGRQIGRVVGANVRHYCAELGGNCPVLVFDDCGNAPRAAPRSSSASRTAAASPPTLPPHTHRQHNHARSHAAAVFRAGGCGERRRLRRLRRGGPDMRQRQADPHPRKHLR